MAQLDIRQSYAMGTRKQRLTKNVTNVGNENYTVERQDQVILHSPASTNKNVTLPPSDQFVGRKVTIKKVNADAANTVVNVASSGTIDGAASVSIATQYNFLGVIASETEWNIVATDF